MCCALLLLLVKSALAHPPYEKLAGTFQRADGAVIQIVRHSIDGIVARDPVAIEFRRQDGAIVARTPHVPDIGIRHVDAAVEVYRFDSGWLPVASHVESFDGFSLTDVTPARRLVSPLIHLENHWQPYLVAFSGLIGMTIAWTALSTVRKAGWQRSLCRIGRAFVAVGGIIALYVILMAAPVSPLVLGMGGLIFAALYRKLRGRAQPTAAA